MKPELSAEIVISQVQTEIAEAEADLRKAIKERDLSLIDFALRTLAPLADKLEEVQSDVEDLAANQKDAPRREPENDQVVYVTGGLRT